MPHRLFVCNCSTTTVKLVAF